MKLDVGILGAGGFAHFAATAFLECAGIKIVAINDINETAANEMAEAFYAKSYLDFETFLKDESIDLVYIATPPCLHYQQSKQALLAGKHVICEKPAALRTVEAEELAALADANQLLYVVNLMQRYNPLYASVKNIIEEKLAGNFLHGFFENYASDEFLDINHWFWNKSKSGGIFIEHGVHFFDMFSGWFGEGKVLNAFQLKRSFFENEIVDRVQATVLYNQAAVNFYHGFDQPKILDRQEMRLLFELGEITLYEWIPVRMKLHGLFKREQLERLKELLKDFSIEYHKKSEPLTKKVKGRFNEIIFEEHVTIEYGNTSEKQNRYKEMLKAMISDQWNWIKDRKHIRVIDSANAVESLRIAEQATLVAQKIEN
jgi:predicted dehydrogenase